MKIARICEKLLFTNTEITMQDLMKECNEILPAFAERIVAFLNVLPKDYALYLALESVFEYLILDQELLSQRTKRAIRMVENLLEKPNLEKYELVTGMQINTYFPHTLSSACVTMLRKRTKSLSATIVNLSQWLGELWIDFHDKKDLEYNITFNDINNRRFKIKSRKVYENFEQMARSVLARVRKYSGLMPDPRVSFILYSPDDGVDVLHFLGD